MFASGVTSFISSLVNAGSSVSHALFVHKVAMR